MDFLRNAIATVFQSWESLPRIAPDWRIESIQDTQRDRYILQHVSFPGEQHRSHTLAHLTIRDGKIWILSDNTEEGIATELVAAGIPKESIVLAFYPPSVREIGEFAIR
jgi:hypothetical protein